MNGELAVRSLMGPVIENVVQTQAAAWLRVIQWHGVNVLFHPRIRCGSRSAMSGKAMTSALATISVNQNGVTPRYTRSRGTPVAELVTKLNKPTGGVRNPVSSIMMLMTPNQTPS